MAQETVQFQTVIMLTFSANLGFLFTQEASSLVQRIKLAAAAGFKGAEIPYPYEIAPSVSASSKESNGVEVILLNSWPGDLSEATTARECPYVILLSFGL